MKKLLLFFIAATLSISCSSDNNKTPSDIEEPKSDNTNIPSDVEESKDTIIGTWKLVEKGSNTITGCDTKDTYTFNQDASYTFEDYNTASDSCTKDDKKSFKGTWKNNNNNTYNIKKHGYTGNGADININFTEDKQYLTFSSNGLTYKRQ